MQHSPTMKLWCLPRGSEVPSRHGDIPVEDLAPGLEIRDVSQRPVLVSSVTTIRSKYKTDDGSRSTWPIRIRANAIADGVPRVDVVLLQDQVIGSVGLNDTEQSAPVHTCDLVNGATILREQVDVVDWVCVSIETEYAIMIKGIVLPGETPATDAQPSYHIVERNLLQPRSPFDIPSGPAHAALRQRLIERAQRLGHMNVTDPGLLVIIGDQDVSPEVDGRWCRFTLPYPVTEVVLASRSCVPAAQSGSADSRNLGVSVSRIRAGDHEIPLDDPSLQVGWHDPEKNWRWTAGAAHIILPEPTQNLDIEVSGTVQSGYPACRPDYNGSVDACTLSFVSGWALWDGKQAVLDVFVNNRLSGRTVCDKPGQGVRQKGLPTDAGFMFVFPQPITPSDTVSVHFSDGTGLRGSPSHPDSTAPPLTLLTKQETRKIVIVLGMHRSGTSLTSSVLSSLGVDMSDDIAVQPSNARGHWERKELVHFHDRVLRLFERDWYDSRHALDLPSTWWTQPPVRNIRDEMITWLAARLPGVRVFGFKDPRTARMLPMWHEICAILNLEPCYVYCVRNPSQVAASLLARDGIETRDTEYRWMVYNSHAVLGVGDRPEPVRKSVCGA